VLHGWLRKRRAAVIAAVGAGLLAAAADAQELPGPSPVPVPDYVQYWAAARVNLAGGNPYSWHELLAAERLAEPSIPTPVLMWNPPWTLALAALPSLLPFQQSRALWLVVSSLALAASACQLWRFWGGGSGRVLAVAAVALAFPPSVFALAMGQMSPLLLLGVAGFLYFERRGRLEAAGAVAAVTLVKPQVVYLLWVALFLWSLHGRRWRFLAGAAASIAAMSAVPLATNPRVFLDYLQALSGRAPDYFVTPTAGTLVRLLAGWEYTSLMFAPALAGLVWLLRHWSVHRRDWQWSAQISMVLLVSVVTSPYAWLFDQVVLLLPALQIAVGHGNRPSRRTKRALAVYGAAVVAAFVMLPWNVNVRDVAGAPQGLLREALTTPNMFWHVTIAPVFLAGFLVFCRGESRG
jgi:hypothetical protein